MSSVKQRQFLVLWQTANADSWAGLSPTMSEGSHMKGLLPGDRIFIVSCDDDEIHLLGALRVKSAHSRKDKFWIRGRTLSGPFQFLALGTAKWRLRFEQTASTRLQRGSSLLWQIRARRHITAQTAELLLQTLREGRRLAADRKRIFSEEGRKVEHVGTRRERDPKVRRAALRTHGHSCMVCDLEPGLAYGRFARECLDVHHLEPIGSGSRRSRTSLADVIVLCPTCHRALHLSGDPAAWKQFKRQYQQ